MLLLDIGNTAIKCRLIQEGTTEDRVFPLHKERALTVFSGYLQSLTVDNVYIACVASEASYRKITERINRQQPKVTCTRLFTQPELNGISNAYPDYSQLGVDRWLTLLAASQLVETDVMIIDAGSAITIDLLSRKNGHLGGAILPGFKTGITRFRQMFPSVDFKDPRIEETQFPGRSTTACINLSKIPVNFNQLQNIVNDWLGLLDHPCQILLSGQDALKISLNLNQPNRIVADLVFTGMLKQIQIQ